MKRSTLKHHFIGLGLGLAVLATTVKADQEGVLYTMNNASGGNRVLVFGRHANGTLTGAGSFATGGAGTGTPQGLPSQGSVQLSHDGRWLFVCNAGSSEISVFAVSGARLTFADKVASGGQMPLSLGFHHNLLYVLNAGGLAGAKDNITAFIFADGKLTPLPNSTRALSGDNTGPAQVSFTRDGGALVVTERVTSLIDIFVVGDDGLAADLKTFQSVGTTPFGFDVGRRGRVFVSEAAGGAANASSASSYEVAEDGDLAVLSGAVPTQQTAACWLITSQDGRFVYTANAGSGSISGFRVGPHGSLALLDVGGLTGMTGNGSHPTDMAQSRDGRFLYSLNNGNGTVSAFRVQPDGSIESLMVINGLPTSTAGLAGR
jgi:6-phosphogluconolactonase